MLRFFKIATLLLFLGGMGNAQAALIKEEQAFLKQQFVEVPKAQYLWLTGDLKKQSIAILGHSYPKIRVAYWQPTQTSNQSVWILEEIGKEKPITIGVRVVNNQIESLRILKFRESRGWEVKLPSFTQQFDNVSFENQQLNRTIDGISGATLSVRAVTKIAKLALLFHQKIADK